MSGIVAPGPLQEIGPPAIRENQQTCVAVGVGRCIGTGASRGPRRVKFRFPMGPPARVRVRVLCPTATLGHSAKQRKNRAQIALKHGSTLVMLRRIRLGGIADHGPTTDGGRDVNYVRSSSSAFDHRTHHAHHTHTRRHRSESCGIVTRLRLCCGAPFAIVCSKASMSAGSKLIDDRSSVSSSFVRRFGGVARLFAACFRHLSHFVHRCRRIRIPGRPAYFYVARAVQSVNPDSALPTPFHAAGRRFHLAVVEGR